MNLYLIVRFSYYTHLHLHLLRSVVMQCGSYSFIGYVGETYTPYLNSYLRKNVKFVGLVMLLV